MKTLTRIRRATSAKLRGAPLPEVFAGATIASATRNTCNPRDARRLADKAIAVLAVLAVTACGGHVGDSSPDFAERYAHDACECADPGPCVELEIVARLRAPDVNVECVEAYSDAMETRASCTDYSVAMPSCDMVPSVSPAERYTRAVCACHGDNWKGCYDNIMGEVAGWSPECLNARAAAYESDCSGRSVPACEL